MPVTIAIPTTPILEPLVAQAEQICAEHGFSLLRDTEARCAAALLGNTADIALVTPLGYGMGVEVADYRVIPATMLSLDGYTRVITAVINPKSEHLRTFFSPFPDDFASFIAREVLNEKFDLTLLDISKQKTSTAPADITLEYGCSDENAITLDIADEWADVFGTQLPYALWVCRPDAVPAAIAELLTAMAAPAVPKHRHIHEPIGAHSAEREGIIYWAWHDEAEEDLNEMLRFLFYHRLLPSIPAVKILGRDAVE